MELSNWHDSQELVRRNAGKLVGDSPGLLDPHAGVVE